MVLHRDHYLANSIQVNNAEAVNQINYEMTNPGEVPYSPGANGRS